MSFAPTLFAGLTLLGNVKPMSEPELLERAKQVFAQGVRLAQDHKEEAVDFFSEAAQYLDELEQRGVRNADFHLFQGNAHFLGNELAAAILAYRKGLAFDPGHKGLQEHLSLARRQVVYPVGGPFRAPTEGWPAGFSRPTYRTQFFCALACYVLGLGGFCWWYAKRRMGAAILAAACTLVAASIVIGLVFQQRREAYNEQHPIVVIQRNDVVLRLGNGNLYPSVVASTLNRGVEARLRHRLGGWLLIELEGGQVGWIPRDAALVENRVPIADNS
ncbi:MAG: hypothetical protein KatS3mg105_4543 [Gemmatales bacterium]|nr:MAG: hypothetical protein KatS3mg105_4543 [Gemmatales bacterium]